MDAEFLEERAASIPLYISWYQARDLAENRHSVHIYCRNVKATAEVEEKFIPVGLPMCACF